MLMMLAAFAPAKAHDAHSHRPADARDALPASVPADNPMNNPSETLNPKP